MQFRSAFPCKILTRLLLLAFVTALFTTELNGQIKGYVSPVPPDAFQFIKYSEIPVSEYTGIPEIKIPIYTLNSGNAVFPISLQYHAGGVRVSEEASWVGLGWNLDVGNVTQIVNDRDDLANFEKILPDYYYYGYRYDFSWRHAYPATSPTPPFGFSPSTGITPSQPYHSFVSYMDYYFPLGGSYDLRTPSIANADGGPDEVDSEPDVFKASFNGHYIEFVKDFNSGSFVVLNRKNYRIVKVVSLGKSVWRITSPDGIQYYFDEIDEEVTELSCSRIERPFVSTNCSDDASLISRTWHLTKVVTTAGVEINFNWEKVNESKGLPAFSQKIKYKDYLSSQGVNPCVGWSKIYDFRSTVISDLSGYSSMSTYDDGPYDETLMNTFFSVNAPRAQSYLKTIQMPSVTIEFKTSSRIDRPGESKLDSVLVKNSFGNKIKSYFFNYSYFISPIPTHSVDQDFPSYYDYDYTVEQLTHRLKLVNVRESGVPAFEFTYDSENLPIKTSYATDYWGFYNGAVSNTSFIPNPIHINKVSLGNNSNDRRPYVQYSRAGSLIQIKYPTSGILSLEYELNTFSNAVSVPVSSGCGLRVKSTTHSTGVTTATKTKYTYESGKLILGDLIFFVELFNEGKFSSQRLIEQVNIS